MGATISSKNKKSKGNSKNTHSEPSFSQASNKQSLLQETEDVVELDDRTKLDIIQDLLNGINLFDDIDLSTARVSDFFSVSYNTRDQVIIIQLKDNGELDKALGEFLSNNNILGPPVREASSYITWKISNKDIGPLRDRLFDRTQELWPLLTPLKRPSSVRRSVKLSNAAKDALSKQETDLIPSEEVLVNNRGLDPSKLSTIPEASLELNNFIPSFTSFDQDDLKYEKGNKSRSTSLNSANYAGSVGNNRQGTIRIKNTDNHNVISKNVSLHSKQSDNSSDKNYIRSMFREIINGNDTSSIDSNNKNVELFFNEPLSNLVTSNGDSNGTNDRVDSHGSASLERESLLESSRVHNRKIEQSELYFKRHFLKGIRAAVDRPGKVARSRSFESLGILYNDQFDELTIYLSANNKQVEQLLFKLLGERDKDTAAGEVSWTLPTERVGALINGLYREIQIKEMANSRKKHRIEIDELKFKQDLLSAILAVKKYPTSIVQLDNFIEVSYNKKTKDFTINLLKNKNTNQLAGPLNDLLGKPDVGETDAMATWTCEYYLMEDIIDELYDDIKSLTSEPQAEGSYTSREMLVSPREELFNLNRENNKQKEILDTLKELKSGFSDIINTKGKNGLRSTLLTMRYDKKSKEIVITLNSADKALIALLSDKGMLGKPTITNNNTRAHWSISKTQIKSTMKSIDAKIANQSKVLEVQQQQGTGLFSALHNNTGHSFSKVEKSLFANFKYWPLMGKPTHKNEQDDSSIQEDNTRYF